MSKYRVTLVLPSQRHVQEFVTSRIKNSKYLAIKVPFIVSKGESIQLIIQSPLFDDMHFDCLIRSHEKSGDKTLVLVENDNFNSIFYQNENLVSDTLSHSNHNDLALNIEFDPPTPADCPVYEQALTNSGDRDIELSTQWALIDKMTGEIKELPVAEFFVKMSPKGETVYEKYLHLISTVHPDNFLETESKALIKAASKITSEINRAFRLYNEYEREKKRQDLFAVPKDGWFIALDDTGVVYTPLPLWSSDSASLFAQEETTQNDESVADAPLDEEKFIESIRELIAQSKLNDAKIGLKRRLALTPRFRKARALLHVVQGQEKCLIGERTRALMHFEAALSHDPDCMLAYNGTLEIRKVEPLKKNRFGKFFK